MVVMAVGEGSSRLNHAECKKITKSVCVVVTVPPLLPGYLHAAVGAPSTRCSATPPHWYYDYYDYHDSPPLKATKEVSATASMNSSDDPSSTPQASRAG